MSARGSASEERPWSPMSPPKNYDSNSRPIGDLRASLCSSRFRSIEQASQFSDFCFRKVVVMPFLTIAIMSMIGK